MITALLIYCIIGLCYSIFFFIEDYGYMKNGMNLISSLLTGVLWPVSVYLSLREYLK